MKLYRAIHYPHEFSHIPLPLLSIPQQLTWGSIKVDNDKMRI